MPYAKMSVRTPKRVCSVLMDIRDSTARSTCIQHSRDISKKYGLTVRIVQHSSPEQLGQSRLVRVINLKFERLGSRNSQPTFPYG